ncbi:MAG: DUF2071 domain-containing protein [Candidatus Sumerlaeaceae bacterium]|nr:DUF2071 domain-containing protein [Candidatus Sumerlaeaceae bacterium]
MAAVRPADPFSETTHRPWPMPAGRWVMAQVWHDLLFAHWPVAPDLVRQRIPPPLELDTFDGMAWVGVVPFRMSGVRVRGTPAFPGVSAFPELNVRTYVRHGARAGVWFFSLDAASFLAVQTARAWFHLPYFRATMRCDAEGDNIRYLSRRTHKGAAPADLMGTYGPTGPVEFAKPGTLEHWLTERYSLYTFGNDDRLLCGEIHHVPWPLQTAWAEFSINTMAGSHGLDVPGRATHLRFARCLDVRIWPLSPAVG